MSIPIRLAIVLTVAAAAAARAAQETVTYSYDDAGRLVTAVYSSGGSNAAIHYQYDAAGNRTSYFSYAAGDDSDYDGDTVDDVDELRYFGNLESDGSGDPDGDGLVTSNELALGGNPTLSDTDNDSMDDYQESIAGTALDDSTSYFRVTEAEPLGAGQMRLWWDVVTGRTYQLQRNDSLGPVWDDVGSPFVCLANGRRSVDLPLDTNAFFRVEVSLTNP